ncbi:MAG: Peptidase sortase, partial [Pseudonocardia sp.]|nr:Peptidase sortase [Pseudonocardia sp.]
MISALAAPPLWPLGLVATVAAGAVLYAVTGRLRLLPESRAASTAMFATCALLIDLTGDGVDGRATLLLAVAGALAASGRRRSAVAAAAGIGAVVVAPAVAVGLLVLLGAMTLRRDVAARHSPVVRRASGAGALAAAVVLATVLAEPAAGSALPPAMVSVGLVLSALVGGVLWTRAAWLRPMIAAVGALAVCLCVPGPDVQVLLPVAAGLAVLGGVVVEEHRALFARPRRVAAVAAAAVAVALLVPAVAAPSPSEEPRPQAPAAAPGPPAEVAVRPVSLAIDRLRLDGPLAELSVAENGELLAPDDPEQAGWYEAGVVPGDVGPAVIGGHVDSRRGPGVFYRLRSLRPGDPVEVVRSDGQLARFRVTTVREVPKVDFPTVAVYGPTPRPELRLITCGGRFDRQARSYTENVVVEA